MLETLEVDPQAVAIQLVRADHARNEFCYYEAMTFPKDPHGGVQLWVHRANCLGMVATDETQYMADLLSGLDTVVQEVPLTERGFRYLRDKLRPRREYD